MRQDKSNVPKRISPAKDQQGRRFKKDSLSLTIERDSTTKSKSSVESKSKLSPVTATLSEQIDDGLELKIPKVNPSIGYLNKEDGLYFYKLIDGTRRLKDEGVCIVESPIRVLFKFANEDRTGNYGKVIEFKNADGKSEEMAISNVQLENPAELRKLLRDKDLEFPFSSKLFEHFANFLIYSKPKLTKTVVTQTGWISSKRSALSTFVLPKENIGRNSNEYYFASPEDDKCRNYIYENGTLKGWQEKISKPFGLASKRAILAICAELASPLMALKGGDSGFLLNFYGQSTKGKTTFLRVAQSALGSAKGRDITGWEGTPFGMEGFVKSHHDLTACIDELSTANDINDLLSFVYSIGNGSKKWRGKADLSLQDPKMSRGLIITTSEDAFREKQEDNNGRPKVGALARCLDIPFSAAAGKKDLGIFDVCPIVPTDTGPKMIDLTSKTGGLELESYLERIDDYGHAVPAFIKCLVALINDTELTDNGLEHLLKVIDDLRKGFIKDVIPDGVNSTQILRVAGNFSILYTAGMLASGYNDLIDSDLLKSIGYDEEIENITGWEQSLVSVACKELFHEWLENHGTTQDAEIAYAVKRLYKEIETNLTNYASVDSLNSRKVGEFPGWIEDKGPDEMHVYMLSGKFDTLVSSRLIKQKLIEQGILIKDKSCTYQDKVSLPAQGRRRQFNVYHVVYKT